MGTSEEKTPFKPSKPASSAQDIPPTPYPDWSNSMQAYYGGGGTPNPFFPSPVGSPSPHPYMWGAQHHMMPPYGTPVPYPAMYPPGAVYAHPSMPMPPASGPTNKETVKDQASGKKSKGNLKRKGDGGEKAPSGSGNDGVSQSDESVTAGSSDENDENANHQEQGSVRKPSFGQMLADASSQSNTTGEIQGSVPMKPVAPGTNLNIGMDLWASQAGVPVKDERELKRQKRKQSNRESARRSRLRKQAECEQLPIAGVNPSESIAVGDSLHHDIKGANVSGIESVFITGGIHGNELGLTCFDETASVDSVKSLAAKHDAFPSYVLSAFKW